LLGGGKRKKPRKLSALVERREGGGEGSKRKGHCGLCKFGEGDNRSRFESERKGGKRGYFLCLPEGEKNSSSLKGGNNHKRRAVSKREGGKNVNPMKKEVWT